MNFKRDELIVMRDSMVALLHTGAYSKEGASKAAPLIDKIDKILDFDSENKEDKYKGVF